MVAHLFDISSRKAIVTGGGRGLGHSIAEGLLKAGAEVVLIDISESIHMVADDFRSRGLACCSVRCDLGDTNARESGFKQALTLLSDDIDILFTCAGIQKRHTSESFPLEDWTKVLEINLTAVFDYCQKAGRVMLSKGYGKIVNIASMLSFFGGYTVPAYAASKGAVAQLTKALSNEWASRGININAIAPGYMMTDMNTELTNPENPRYKEITNRIPQRRWGSPVDLQGIAIFLASHASDYINGAIIPVDGGYLGN